MEERVSQAAETEDLSQEMQHEPAEIAEEVAEKFWSLFGSEAKTEMMKERSTPDTGDEKTQTIHVEMSPDYETALALVRDLAKAGFSVEAVTGGATWTIKAWRKA